MVKRAKPAWSPSPSDYAKVVEEQNPWHAAGKVPDDWAKDVERSLAKCLWMRLANDTPRRFQLIFGPRRVGKTTSMYQAVRHLLSQRVPSMKLWWLRLDHPLFISIPLENLARMVVSRSQATVAKPAYLFLDEITYSRDWDLWLKTFYDDVWPIRLVGTSSSTAALQNRKLESGVGRWEEQYLAPYLFSEYLSLVGKNYGITVKETLYDTLTECLANPIDMSGVDAMRRRFLLTGGFPELLNMGQSEGTDEATLLLRSQRILRADAVDRAIYKDIPQAFAVDSPMHLERLLYTLAGQMAQLLSPNKICQLIDRMSQPTFDRYLTYLERAFLVFTLPNYSGAESSVQRRGRKLYFVDGAVRNAALQRGIAPLSNDTEMGQLLENMVAGHLHALSQQSMVRLYHWRDGDDEVDLVYDHPEKPMAFEISTGDEHHRRGLYKFSQRYPRFKGRCYIVNPYASSQQPKYGTVHEIGSVPLDMFLLAVGAQSQKEMEGRLSFGK